MTKRIFNLMQNVSTPAMTCKTYCILADIGLATQTNGNTTICNQSRTEFKSISGEVLRLDKHSLHDSWNSPTRQEIKQALANNVQHPNCQVCWDEESAGRKSKRLQDNERFAGISALPDRPRAFMFKPGNVCNLGCRHCNPFVSSKWYRDHYQVEVKPNSNISFVDYAHRYDSIRDSYNPDNTNLWPVLNEWNRDIVFYDLYGAEPLLIEPLLETLRTSVKTGAAANQSIHINTNGTIWHNDFAELFSSFKCVELGVSIDAIGEQFEYMRYPAKWDLVLDNLMKYKQLELAYPDRIFISVCITISLLNVYYVKEYVQFFEKDNIMCGINVVHRPDYLNMRIASPAIKEKIIEHLTAVPVEFSGWNDRINPIINLLKLDYNNNNNLMEEFWKFTNKYDEVRNQSYANTFPEFHKVLIDG
jgi:sulfatase maturation enzyme AslB (radical SAM superfamily)